MHMTHALTSVPMRAPRDVRTTVTKTTHMRILLLVREYGTARLPMISMVPVNSRWLLDGCCYFLAASGSFCSVA